MATISSMAFFRNEVPSAQGFNIGAIFGKIVPIARTLLGIPGAPKQAAALPGGAPTGIIPAVTGAITKATPVTGAMSAALAVVQNLAAATGMTTTQALMVLEPQVFIAEFLKNALASSSGQASSLLRQVKSALGVKGKFKHRRIDPLNLRALNRADRRLTRFADIAKRYVRHNAPQKRVHAFRRRKRR